MKITTRDESMQVKPQTEPDKFTGEAGFHVLHVADVPAAPSPPRADPARGAGTWNTYAGNVAMLRYEPRARSHWHSHSGGQMLYIVEGDGWVQSRGEKPRALAPGDSVSIEAGEVHWHGAKGTGPMAQLAVTAGKPTWFEAPPPPEQE